MLKKRLVFTLLHADGTFHLSRNFRLQAVGDIGWLERHYVFSEIAAAIDELVILDVSRRHGDRTDFLEAVRTLARTTFVPMTVGGRVRAIDDAHALLQAGADKVLVNTPVTGDEDLIHRLAATYGAQCVVASVDVGRRMDGSFEVRVENAERALPGAAREVLARVARLPVGDLYLNSIDRDGTGQGYDLAMLDELPDDLVVPLVLAGGAGNARHLAEGLQERRVDAVATAHLLNFVGGGLGRARLQLVADGIDLPLREIDVRDLRGAVADLG